ncbi:MAG: pyrroline-5-carboxylate reductase [Pantoea sp. Brub]|nr:pyrroline-5-carboxylate reductase [Pantoea sp. Brub]
MLKKKIGFIGVGNITKAIISGLSKNQYINTRNIWIYDHKFSTNRQINKKYNVNISDSPKSLVKTVDILIIGLKPNVALSMLKNIASSIKAESLVISFAAGITLNLIESLIGKHHKIIRIMPNISACVCEGMTSITPNSSVSNTEIREIISIFEMLGKVKIVNEQLIHSIVGISSSAPAYVFMFIESMIDAAILNGINYTEAHQFVAQTVKGAAQMVLSTKKHPAELKNMVCSPGGTTIEAIKILEEKQFRAAIIEAVQQCIIKSNRLSAHLLT